MKKFYLGSALFVAISLVLIPGLTWSQQVITQTYTNTTPGANSFIVPAGVTRVNVQVWGGGGGGGGADSNGSENRAGGGGAGGSYTSVNNVVVVPAANITVTVGAGGAGGTGANSPTAGGTGGTSTFASGVPVSAVGGAGGQAGIATNETGAGGPVTTGVTANGGSGAEAPPGGGDGTNATASGAGGGSGGPGGAGGNATGTTPGSGNGGGAGAAGLSGLASGTSGVGNNATEVGGGGSGGWDNLDDNNTGNGAAGGDGFRGEVIVSYVLPTAAITRLTPASAATNAGTVTFRVTFSETVTGVALADFAKAGSAAGTLNAVNAVSGTAYDVVFTGVGGNGNLNLDFAGSPSITSATGNDFIVAGGITTEEEYTIDTTQPTVVLDDDHGDAVVRDADVVVITATFTEANGLGGTPTISIAGLTAPISNVNMTATGNPLIWTYSWNVPAGDDGAHAVSISATDAAGNANTAATAGTGATSYTIDNIAPTVVLDDDHGDALVRDADAVVITATFTEANSLSGTPTISIAGLSSPISNVNMTATGNPLIWTYSWDVPAGDDGTHAVSISVTDVAGNPNAAATAGTGATTYTIDNTGPSVVLNDDHADAIVRDADVVVISAVFTEANGLSGTPTISIAGLTAPISNEPMTATGNPLIWTYSWDVPAGDNGAHAVSISALDVAGNSNSAATAGTGPTSYTIDNVAPVVLSVTSNAGAAGTLKIGDQITFTVDIQTTEAGLTISPTIYNGGTLTWSAVSGGDTYTATYTVASGETDQTSALQLTGVTATDVTGNTSGAVAGADVVKLIDANNPPAFTTGTATTLTAPVVTGFWNSSNTGININVPIPADVGGQFSLVGGVVKIQGRVGADAFADIAGVTASIAGGEPGTTKIVALTDTQFESIANFANGQTAQLRAVITDVAGNFTTGGTSATNIFIDQSAPAVQTVGSLTTTGGRVVALYWNSTNTGLDVVVPLSNADATLDNGTVQLQLMVTGGSFANIPGTGLSTITNGERLAGTKTISVTAANLEAAPGFAEGLVSGFRGVETQFLIIRAVATDAAGNSANFNQSTTQLDVDQNAPTVTSPIRVYSNAGTGTGDGNHEVILFTVSEPLTDHSATPVERGHDFAFIAADNSYGSTGISVDDGLTDEVRYFNDDNPNSIDNTFNNTQLIYVESKDNTSNWSVANATNARHVRGTDATNTNAIMRDPAGNQLVNFITTVTAGSTTTLSAAASGVAASPLVNSATNQVVHAFALTSTASLNLTALTVNTVGDPAGLLSNFRLFSFSGADDFSSASNLGLTPTVGASTITFSSMTVGLSTTTRYFYLVADVAASFPVAAPAIQFNVTTGDFTVSTGGKDGTTQTSLNYAFDDVTSPAVQSISLPSANPNATNSVNFTVSFNEIVNVADNLDFSTYGTASGGGETISFSGSGTTRTVTVSNISLAGTLGLTVGDDNGSITDLQGNPLVTPGAGFSSATQYTMILPEPPNHVTGFTLQPISTTFTSMRVTWTDALGSPVPSGYLVSVERSGATAAAPANFGTPIANQTDLVNNTTGYLNVAPGVQEAIFSNLLSGETYTFKIYPYTNSGANIDFKIDGVIPTTTPAATLVDNFVWINNQTPVEPTTFPSTTTSSGVAVVNFRFQVYDNGWGSSDNASTKITEVRVQRDASDQIGNWFQALQGAELTDGSTTKTGTIDPGGNFITFTGLYDGVTEFFGEVPDDQQKYYSLKVILNTSLGGTLPQTIDNNAFVFRIRNVDIDVAPNSSTLNSGNDGHSATPVSSITRNRVAVVATQLDFSTDPDPTQLVLANLTSTSAAPDFSTVPVVRARDLNGNTDENFGGASIITINSAGPAVTTTPPLQITMNSGVALLSGVQYQGAGNGTLTASTAATNALGGTLSSGVSTAVTVNYSALTTLTTGGGGSVAIEPLSTASCCVPVYKFTITDDGGAGLGDGSPTRISSITLTKGASPNQIPDWRDFLGATNGGALLYDQSTSSWIATTRTINQNDIVISNMLSTGTASDLGYIPDGGSRSFVLYIYPDQTGMGGGLPATVDDLNFDVEVNPSNIVFAPQSSTLLPAQSAVGSGPVDVDVAATQLVFTTQPPADVLVNADLSTSPIVEARDAHGNRDLDYAPSTGITVTNAGGLPMLNTPTAFIDGVLTFPSNFRYTQIGNGALTLNSSTVATGLGSPPSGGVSTAVTVRVGVAGTITAGALTEPTTISSLVDLTHTPAGLAVFDFTINDDPGGTPVNQNDGNPTQLTYLYITSGAGNTVPNWFDAFQTATLTDGTNTVSVTTIHPSNYFYFDLSGGAGPALGLIGDNASKTYTLTVWLKTALGGSLPGTIDGLNFVFDVQQANIGTGANGSSLLSGQTQNSGPSNNEVTVVATRLDVTSPLAASSVSLTSLFTPVIAARDENANVDLDFGDTGEVVTAFSNTSGATMSNGPVVSTTPFVNGVLDFTSSFPNFQFTAGNNGDDVTLAMTATGPISTVTTPTLTLRTNTITAGALAEPATLSSITTTAPGTAVFDFRINDDDFAISAGVGTDVLPTRISQIVITQLAGQNDISTWTDLMDVNGATLSDGVSTIVGTVNANNITFSGIPNALTNLGFISDNGFKTYTLRIWLKSTLGGTLPATVDNLNIAFEVLANNITTLAPVTQSSSFSSSADGNLQDVENSGAGTNAISVIATKLDWTVNPAADLLVNKDISLQPPVPVVEARDVNNNRDLDYVVPLSITNAGGLGMSSSTGSQSNVTTLSVVADGSAPSGGGIYTFTNDFQYEAIGNGQMTAVPSAPSTVLPHPDQVSTAVTVRVGIASTITAGALTEPTTVSSLADNDGVASPVTGGTDVFDFTINDDPGVTPANQDDGNPTRIQSILITQAAGNTIANWSDAIAAAQLTDGTSSGFGTISATTIDFGGGGGIPNAAPTDPGYIADNASKTYTLKIWLKESLGGSLPSTIDGLRFAFGVDAVNVVTNPNGTSIIGTETENSGANNQVTVVATQIDYSQLDGSDNFITPYAANFPSTGSIFTDFSPRLGVEAHDENANRDLDFTGTVTSFTAVTAGVTTQNDPSGSFTAGTLKFPANFNYTAGNNQDGKLRISAGGINNQESPSIIITSSFDSWLYFDPTFAYTTNIPFVSMQETTLTNTANSVELARLILSDGGAPGSAVNPAGTKNLPFGSHNDLDGAFTRIDQLTISLTNFGDIRKIALFDALGNKVAGTEQNAAATVTFTGLAGVAALTAPDNDVAQFYLRASFNSTVGADLDQINIQIVNVVWSSGSKFPITDGTTTVGGIDGAGTGGDSSDATKNFIDVVATSLDFVTPGSPYAGINEPLGPTYTTPPLPGTSAAIVHARDKFGNRDLDFSYPAAVTGTTATAVSTAAFINGVLDLDGMEYSSAGNGTLRVIANGIDSSDPPVENTQAVAGQLVNVVHVEATYPSSGVIVGQAGNPGDPLTASIKGGSLAQTIFGVTFTAQGATGSEPVLKEFSFTFDIDYTGIFENFVVREGSNDVKGFGGDVVLSSPNTVTVDLSANPRQLFAAPGQTLTYYLIADVSASADISTPPITPRFEDAGYGSATDDNILVSRGTAVGSFNGNVYSFASTKPPVLRTAKTSLTRPFAGQLNVDPALDHILLDFDTEVTALDGGLNGGAEIYNRTTNVKVADLVAPLSAGNYLFQHIGHPTFDEYDYDDVINPLRYNIQFLPGQSFESDEVYYVVIKQGSFNPLATPPTGGTGISDKGLNFFGGISSNSTLYFKISSDDPLLLGDIDGTVYNTDVASISTRFDQFGTAYYLMVEQGSPAPTVAQVKSPSAYPTQALIAASGNYEITQINVLQTATFPGTFVANQTYDLYVYAENDAQPIPVSAGGVYGSNLLAGTGGPTLEMVLPLVPPAYQPSYLICPNSYVLVSEPIIITESSVSAFSSGASQPGNDQDFNILLPSGYSFDLEILPTVQLIGSDFNGQSAELNFESNSVLKIAYKNFGSAGIDHIVISNLRIQGASGSPTLPILRFYGNNSSFATPTASLGTVGIFASSVPDFDNSYNRDNRAYFPLPSELPNGTLIPEFVNAIPSNYIDDETNATAIRLLPQIETANDYNASIFTGTGVTNDILTLSAVAKNSAFNITMNHTDPNGCILQTTQQYLVYDHVSPISSKLGSAANGSAQALLNPGFPSPVPMFTSQQLVFNELAGYRLLGLTADLPARVLKGQQNQIMKGNGWREVIKRIPNTPTAVPVPPFGNFYNYTWDYSHVLNADTATVNPPITLNPYYGDVSTRFDAQTTTGNTYWKGGSLGQVEFTGVFQSSADLSVTIPFRQYVELFVPAVPLVEISSSNQSATDQTDQTLNNVDGKTPVEHINLLQYTNPAGYEGTPIFCEAGGNITLNGFPASLSGTSTGTFAIYDYQSFNFNSTSNTPLIAPAPNSAFIDNLNGTASLDPSNTAIKNGYNDILISYTYQENNSPAVGVGYLIIRIVPNPVANVVASSLKTSTVLYTGTDFCDGKEIIFDATGSSLASGGKTGEMSEYSWSFGDDTPIIAGPEGEYSIRNHTYAGSRGYTASLTVETTYGCLSPAETLALRVGAIPEATFTFLGVSTADDISFTNTSTLGSAVTVNDDFSELLWTYDSINAPGVTNLITSNFSDPVTNNYTNAGVYKVNLHVTSVLGCSDDISHDIIVVPRESVTDTDAYVEDFESNDGGWQHSALGTSISSWAHGTPGAGKTAILPEAKNGTGIWVTNLNGFYNSREESALYSPSFDISSLERPMISFDHFTHLAAGEGVAIEYSTDNKNLADPTKVWKVLGEVGSGVEWYNANGLSSQPGFENFEGFGWSSVDTEWSASESKHILDSVRFAPQVVFRFALATLTTNPDKDGFAIDNVRVGNRTRTVLVENFKNLGNDTQLNGRVVEEEQSEVLSDFKSTANGTRLVKVNYHVGFPKKDPFNIDNPQDPSSRALYYNVRNTPIVKMDGGGFEEPFSTWGSNYYDVQTLKLANARIDIDVSTANDGSLGADVTITSVAKDLGADTTLLHVMVVEKNINRSDLPTAMQNLITTGEDEFEFVMKKMLPSASGTRFTQALADGQSQTFSGFTWTPDRTRLYTVDNLAIIAFVQGEKGREVFQAEIRDLGTDPPAVTGLEPGLTLDDVTLYPNPADDEVTLRLPRNAVADVNVELFDQAGRAVQATKILKGQREKTLNVRELPASVYLIKLEENGHISYKRAMVIHRN